MPGLRSARSALARLIGADPNEGVEVVTGLPVRLVEASEELAELGSEGIAARIRVEDEKLVQGNAGLISSLPQARFAEISARDPGVFSSVPRSGTNVVRRLRNADEHLEVIPLGVEQTVRRGSSS